MMATEIEFLEVDVPPTLSVQVSGRCAPDPASIGAAIMTAFGTLHGLLSRHSLAPAGPPRVIYNSYGAEGVSFTLAMPLAGALPGETNDPSLHLETLPGTRAYRFSHHGPYRNLMQTYGQITAFMKSKGWMQTDADWARYMPMWEEYRNDPEKTPEAELLTYIYLPAA